MSDHAFLSPSAAHRWLVCTKSAHLESRFPDIESEAAAEGTLAHRLGELMLKLRLKFISIKEYAKELTIILENKFCDNTMVEHCKAYADFVMEEFNAAKAHTKDASIHLEHKIDLSGYVEDGHGRGDTFIIANDTLEYIDLKYGKGVKVEAQDNPQMKLYVLGALKDFDYLFDIKKVRMTIFQPRLDNYSSWEIPVNQLKYWGENIVKPIAKQAFNNEGNFVPGSHCKFCKAKPACKALADYNLELTKYEFEDPAELTDNAICTILDRTELFTDWLKSVNDYAFEQAIKHGKKWAGYKLVEGRSNRKYADEDAVADRLLEDWEENEIYKKELLGITAMEKFLGKLKFDALIGDLIIKPPGKPTLVPESDKRPELNGLAQAQKDFND